MKLLLLAATPPEITPTVVWLRERANRERQNVLIFPRVEITLLFGGLGILSTAFALGHHFAGPDKPTLAIQAGIAGAVDRELALSTVVNVTSEHLLDFGAEDADGNLLNPGQIGLPLGFPYNEQELLVPTGPSAILPYPTVAGGTVQRTTGTLESLARIQDKFPEVQVESMEGGAFFYACMSAGVECLQLRSISNYVGVRDRNGWEIAGAIRSLDGALRKVLGPFLQ